MFGRRRLPVELRPSLARDERVLAWARVDDRTVVVATNRGLRLPGYEPRRCQRLPQAERARDHQPAPGTFVGWHEIHKAAWTGRELTITPAAVIEERDGYVVTADRPPVTMTVPDAGDLPQVVRTRVTRSVSFSSHHLVPGGGVRVVARRVPGVDGLSWAVRYDDGTDPRGPGVVDATDQLVRVAINS